jgi:predicted nuclease of predicted toxin-antitoxin system
VASDSKQADSQIPTEAGHDALHTLDLRLKNGTSDNKIIARSMQDARVVVTKDDDFMQAFLLAGEPSDR